MREVGCPKSQVGIWQKHGLNPSPLIPDLGFLTSISALPFITCGLARVHSMSHIQMWAGPNTHQLLNIKQCGSEYTKSHLESPFTSVLF